MTKQSDTSTKLMVCRGSCNLIGNKKGVHWMRLDSLDQNDGRSVLEREKEFEDCHEYYQATGKSSVTGSIGQIKEFEATDTGLRGNGKHVGRWANQNDIVHWQLEAELVDTARKTAKEEAQHRAVNELRDAMKPVRAMYQAARTHRARAMILASVIDYVQHGSID